VRVLCDYLTVHGSTGVRPPTWAPSPAFSPIP
jgi:hypothetical protein